MGQPLLTPDEVQIVQGGIAGIGIQALFSRKVMSWWMAMTIFLTGGSLAWWGTPIAAHLLGWKDDTHAFVALMLAFCGPFIFGAIVSAGTAFSNDPFAVLKRLLPRWFEPKEDSDD